MTEDIEGLKERRARIFAALKADRWDAMQCPARYVDPEAPEPSLFGEAA